MIIKIYSEKKIKELDNIQDLSEIQLPQNGLITVESFPVSRDEVILELLTEKINIP